MKYDKCCVINFAGDSYANGRNRLLKSLKTHSPNIDVLSFTKESEIGCPTHSENPYAFKPYAFLKAIELGYQYILWMDASLFAIKPIEPIFDVIIKEGYFMQEAGHYVATWCNQNALNYFKLTDEEKEKMLMFTAGFQGLNINNLKASTYLTEWKKSEDAGCFIGSWLDHRHDMTCGSIIASRLNMTYKNGSEWLAYASPEQEVNETILVKAQGIN